MLLVELNKRSLIARGEGEVNDFYTDVKGDGSTTALDLLYQINYVNEGGTYDTGATGSGGNEDCGEVIILSAWGNNGTGVFVEGDEIQLDLVVGNSCGITDFVSIDWCDGSTDSGWGDVSAVLENFHLYADDNPTATPQDNYIITSTFNVDPVFVGSPELNSMVDANDALTSLTLNGIFADDDRGIIVHVQGGNACVRRYQQCL